MEEKQSDRRRKRPVSAVLLRPEYARLGKWIGLQREQAGLSQRELSRRVGMPVSYVNKIELGQRRLDLVEFLDLAATIGLDPGLTLNQLRKAAEGS